MFLARLKLAQGDAAGAAALLHEADAAARQYNFMYQIPEVAAAQVVVMLQQGDLSSSNLASAAQLAETHDLAISQARVYLALKDPAAALAVLEPLYRKVEAKGWEDERLKVIILEAVAHHAAALQSGAFQSDAFQAGALQAEDETDKAVNLLCDALALAEPGGFIRIFVDEGAVMVHLLTETLHRGIARDYVLRLLTEFSTVETKQAVVSPLQALPSGLDEPLSQRELEVLQLIAQGLSNDAICQRLFLALSTVKGHNQIIFGKLQVQRRTEAVARARELGLL